MQGALKQSLGTDVIQAITKAKTQFKLNRSSNVRTRTARQCENRCGSEAAAIKLGSDRPTVPAMKGKYLGDGWAGCRCKGYVDVISIPAVRAVVELVNKKRAA